MNVRRVTLTVAAIGIAALGILTPPPAESQVILETYSIVIRGTDPDCGTDPCAILDIDSVDMVLGQGPSSDTLFGEDVDLTILDYASDVGTFDPVFDFNSSLGDLRLGSGTSTNPGDDGNLFIEDGAGDTTLSIDGGTGNIFQDVENVSVGNGNGAIKAWAKINSNGSIFSCWRCNTNTAETRRLGVGTYEVDFLLGDITNRPCLMSTGTHTTTDQTDKLGECFNQAGDTSTKEVETNDVTGADSDGSFTVIIF